MLTLIGLGAYSVSSIAKESAPEVQIPVGVITTVLPGAPATDIETLVTNEIERSLQGSLDDIKTITSVSREGVSNVTVEFDARANIDDSIADLKDEIDTIKNSLPNNAEDPIVTAVDFVDQPIFTFAIAGDRTDQEFSELADSVSDRIEAVAGVSRVEVQGNRTPEVSVIVDQARLAQFNISLTDITNALRAANNTFPIGQIITNDISYNIVFTGNIERPSEVADIPITTRGGQPVYIRDVATVREGLQAAATFSRLSVASNPSENSITFNVYKKRGGDITAIARDLRAELTKLQEPNDLLSAVTTFTILDAGQDIASELTQLITSGMQTILLVVFILIIAIGWREGLIAGTAIPLSFTIGFIGLYLSGNTINFISLFSLILGIGILVDSSIVMVEGINRRLKEDPTADKTRAAIDTIKEFAAPITSGTLTTVSMFAGLFIVSGVTGQFIASIPFTLIFILFASLLVALGFIPLIASLFLRRRNRTQLEARQAAYTKALEGWYQDKLQWLLSARRRKVGFVTLIILGFFSAIALIPAGLVSVVFFPTSDSDVMFIEVELPESSIKETTDVAARRIEEILYQYREDIAAFTTTVGAGNAFTGGGQNAKIGSFYLVLGEDRSRSSQDLSRDLRTDFRTQLPDLTITVSQLSDGPPTGDPIGVNVRGDDLNELTDTANAIARILAEIEGTVNVNTSTNSNSTEIVLELDRARTAQAGLTPQAVSQVLRAAVYGTDATTITSLTDDIEVVVRLNLTDNPNISPDETNRTTLSALENINLQTPAGDTILLSTLVTPRLREASTEINHTNQEREVTVSSDITATGNVREINATLLERLEQDNIVPSGISVTLGGETEESDQAFQELFLALIVGVVLMIAVLVLQFNSFRHTFYVLSILPFSLIGILYGLMITGSALSFPSIMGFIALSGIVVNNSILLIDQMNLTRKRHPELTVQDVVVKSAASRLRPILLTSITTIGGMLPLLSTDEIWIPLATAIMFGLAFSVVITLFLIPIIYSKYPGRIRE